MTTSLVPGQTSIFDDLVPEESRIWCPFCRSNIGREATPVALENFRGQHAQFGSGNEARCGKMVALGVTEPFYAPGDTPWISGWYVTYPRPVGFRGLEQLRKAQP